jgi:hypothetical protein
MKLGGVVYSILYTLFILIKQFFCFFTYNNRLVYFGLDEVKINRGLTIMTSIRRYESLFFLYQCAFPSMPP